MILIGNLLIGIGVILAQIIWIYTIILFIAVILSWVNPDPSNIIVRFLRGATEPLLSLIRSKIPPLGMLDLSPIIAFLALILINHVVAQSLIEYGNQLKGGSGPGFGQVETVGF